MLLICSIFIAYYLFTIPVVKEFFNGLGLIGYVGIFIAGIMYSFGFTAPFSVGMFAAIPLTNIYLAAFVGGLGSLCTDLFIFTVIKLSFMDEFDRLQKTKPMKTFEHLVNKSISHRLKVILLYAIACFIIASPLPDEIGVSILAGLTALRTRALISISIVLNTVGIGIVLLLTH